MSPCCTECGGRDSDSSDELCSLCRASLHAAPQPGPISGPLPGGEEQPPTRGFRYWMAVSGAVRDDLGNWSGPDDLERAGAVALAGDPIAVARLADLPFVRVPRASDVHGADPRQIWVWSGSRFHWLPGVDGHPGKRPERIVDLRDHDVRLCVDTLSCRPSVLDHGDPPRLMFLSSDGSRMAPPGYEWASDLTSPAGGSAAWRSSIRDACRLADAVAIDPNRFRSSAEAAFVAVVAGTMAVPVWVTSWTSGLEQELHPDVTGILKAIDPNRLESDAYYRDLVGVTIRRHVLEHHSGVSAWRKLAPEEAPPPKVLVMVSTIRPAFLPQVIAYLNSQTFREFEVQIVIDRVPVPPNLIEECTAASEFPVTVRRNEALLTVGEIYNSMMRSSSADIAVIWDDDDHYSADHLLDLVQALVHSGATIAGKWAEFFHLAELGITIQRSPDGRYSDTQSIGGSNLAMWRSQVLSAGGFRPVMSGYDQELVERLRATGASAYRTHGYGYVAERRSNGHTWNPGDEYFVSQSVRQWPDLALASAGFGDPEAAISKRRYR